MIAYLSSGEFTIMQYIYSSFLPEKTYQELYCAICEYACVHAVIFCIMSGHDNNMPDNASLFEMYYCILYNYIL